MRAPMAMDRNTCVIESKKHSGDDGNENRGENGEKRHRREGEKKSERRDGHG